MFFPLAKKGRTSDLSFAYGIHDISFFVCMRLYTVTYQICFLRLFVCEMSAFVPTFLWRLRFQSVAGQSLIQK